MLVVGLQTAAGGPIMPYVANVMQCMKERTMTGIDDIIDPVRNIVNVSKIYHSHFPRDPTLTTIALNNNNILCNVLTITGR
jgi:hypothetical protein